MSKIQDVVADALQRLINSIAASTRWVLGLLGVLISTAATTASGEVIDDLTTYGQQPIDWNHVIKVVGPPILLAIAGYIKHKQEVAVALATPPPGSN